MDLDEYEQRKEAEKKKNPKKKKFSNLGPPRKHQFVIVMEVMSHFLYRAKIKEVDPKTLRMAFDKLFDEGMPKFMLFRTDPNMSLITLNTYFCKKGMLLKVKQGHT